MNTKVGIIFDLLVNFKMLFTKSPDDAALELYANLLGENFTPDQVSWALSKIIRSGTPYFPSCGEIFAQMAPVESTRELAPVVANEILSLISQYGEYDEDRMFKAASPHARAVLKRLGSTRAIRQSENIDTVRAQIERLARSVSFLVEQEVKLKEIKNFEIKTGVRLPDFRLIKDEN